MWRAARLVLATTFVVSMRDGLQATAPCDIARYDESRAEHALFFDSNRARRRTMPSPLEMFGRHDTVVQHPRFGVRLRRARVVPDDASEPAPVGTALVRVDLDSPLPDADGVRRLKASGPTRDPVTSIARELVSYGDKLAADHVRRPAGGRQERCRRATVGAAPVRPEKQAAAERASTGRIRVRDGGASTTLADGRTAPP